MLQFGFGRIVTTIPRRLIGRCRNVDFRSDEQSPVFPPESEVLYPSRAVAPMRSADDPVVAVDLIQIDVVGLETAKARFDSVHDVPARGAMSLWPGPTRL